MYKLKTNGILNILKFTIISTVIIHLVEGCNNKLPFEGYYFNVNNQQIWEFRESKLLVYNIRDSLKEQYSIQSDNKKIKLDNKNTQIVFPFKIVKDTLWLTDKTNFLTNDSESKLIRFELDNIDTITFFNNYWHLKQKNLENDFWIKFYFSENKKYAFMYGKEKRTNNIFLESSFNFNQDKYFNKFWIYKFKSYNWNPFGYLLTQSSKDRLIFKDLSAFKSIELNKYKSKINSQIYGRWLDVSSDSRNLNLISNNSRFYFGDTIEFKKNNIFSRILKDKSNFYYEDSLVGSNSEKNKNLKIEIPFKIGFNTKFIIFNEPIDQILEIKKLTKDSLIIKNHTVGENLLMKYQHIDN
ncbi:MAG: hypothetical protein CSA39_00415 [Flavobacteriales bacterium]|nr:MAG: hypothetical protein CSA39_00415 [Flavobacteriales bacterium]